MGLGGQKKTLKTRFLGGGDDWLVGFSCILLGLGKFVLCFVSLVVPEGFIYIQLIGL